MLIEDYAVIGDMRTAALVSRAGSIDWLCLPRFDSASCLTSLIGTPENGFFSIAPVAENATVSRRYRDDSLVLETTFTTATGSVTLIDCMPVHAQTPSVVRIVKGVSGHVRMRLELVLRFDYGQATPWVRRSEDGLRAVSGPDCVTLHTQLALINEDFRSVAEFEVSEGDSFPIQLVWHSSIDTPAAPEDADKAVEETDAYWRTWAARCEYKGKHRDAVVRSLLTLKALTYDLTGAIVAAVTTSLPERIGGERNWDYRYCWIRDATFTLFAFLHAGYHEEASGFEQWLLRAAAGHPEDLQIMYGLSGERRLTEFELSELAGYESSRPVRVGNLASTQRQLDVYGELMDAIHTARRNDIDADGDAWKFQTSLMNSLEGAWAQTDSGLWEMRGPPRHYTHSKVMAWVAFDRAIASIERFGLAGPLSRWKQIRDDIHSQVCSQGYDEKVGAFTQSYGSPLLDASVLMLPLVGFLPATDARIISTVAAIKANLYKDGFVKRYQTQQDVDGLPPGEGAFLACTFWLVDALVMLDQNDEAEAIYERLLGLRNDVGLLSEEYDTTHGRMLGNFPQAFSHVGLINSARNLFHDRNPVKDRSQA